MGPDMQSIERWAAQVWPAHAKLILRFALATLFSLALVWKIVSPIPTIVDGHFYDRVLASFPVLPQSAVQIISIDEESIKKIGPWPWPEAVHTQFLEQLAQQAPEGVVLNFRLGLPAQTADDDAAMELALRRLRVFFLVQAAPSPAVLKQDAAFLERRKRFASAVAGVGHSTLAPDGAIESLRFIDLFARGDEGTSPYVGALINPVPAVQKAVARGTNLHLGIPFHGELAHPSISYSDVLEGKLLPDQLKGRTIVVGPSRNVALGTLAVLWYVATGTGTGIGTGIGTGTGTTLVSSTEVHASAIDALQQGRYILG
ncbi:CHASE2 domain-containing protein, partial [Variovorax sp. RTB1]|uniref:CHASE2 domain-containing protein n=2 Tax=unclassified Variovorax TaxID=663243 RepID=UPI002B233767